MDDMEKWEKRKDRRALFIMTLFPVLTEISWLGFCLMNRRVAKLTGTAIQMAIGGMNIPDYHEGMVASPMEYNCGGFKPSKLICIIASFCFFVI